MSLEGEDGEPQNSCLTMFQPKKKEPPPNPPSTEVSQSTEKSRESINDSEKSELRDDDADDDDETQGDFGEESEAVRPQTQKLHTFLEKTLSMGDGDEPLKHEPDEIDSIEKFMDVFAMSIHNDGYPFMKQTRKDKKVVKRLLKMDDTRTILSWSSKKMTKKKNANTMMRIEDIETIETSKRRRGSMPSLEMDKRRCVMIVDKHGKHLDAQFTSVEDAEVFVAGMTQLVKNSRVPPDSQNEQSTVIPTEIPMEDTKEEPIENTIPETDVEPKQVDTVPEHADEMQADDSIMIESEES